MVDSGEIVVDPKFNGPSIVALESSIPDIPAEMIDVKWTNTKPEFYVFQKFRGAKKFRLYVMDIQAQERASSFLGRSLQLDSNIIQKGKMSINAIGWREYAGDLGTAVTRSVMIKIAADKIRGGKSGTLASIARDCLLGNINPIDADVLLRLRSLRGY